MCERESEGEREREERWSLKESLYSARTALDLGDGTPVGPSAAAACPRRAPAGWIVQCSASTCAAAVSGRRNAVRWLCLEKHHALPHSFGEQRQRCSARFEPCGADGAQRRRRRRGSDGRALARCRAQRRRRAMAKSKAPPKYESNGKQTKPRGSKPTLCLKPGVNQWEANQLCV